MATLYDELGVRSTASADELRRAYRNRARQLHPDLRPGDEADASEAMTRLNSAWQVLSDPDARRRYDLELALSRAQERAARITTEAEFERRFHAEPSPSQEGAAPPRRLRIRTWAVIVALLAVIFVVTAYAATGGAPVHDPAGRPGQCLTADPGLEVYVDCSQPNVGKLVTEVGPDEPCPAEPKSFRHLLRSRNRVACLTQT